MTTLALLSASEVCCMGGDCISLSVVPDTTFPRGSIARIEIRKVTAYDVDSETYTPDGTPILCYGGSPKSGAKDGDDRYTCYQVALGPDDPEDPGNMTRCKAYMPRVGCGYYMINVLTKRPGGAWVDEGYVPTQVVALPPSRFQEVYDLRATFQEPWKPGVRRPENEPLVVA